jgi:hypothetical protein
LKATINIASQFPKHLFWDMDYSKLSIKKDKETIIPRALFATTQETFTTDILKLEELYTPKVILNVLKNTKERISNNVCVLVAKRYNVAAFYRYKL